MLRWVFDRWEHALANRTNDRVVRPFEWGLDWLPADAAGAAASNDPAAIVEAYAARSLADSDAFFAATPPSAWELDGAGHLTFESQLQTPHACNNVVHARLIRSAGEQRRAVVVLPQWNADATGHIGLGRLFARFGMTALRLSLPYHDWRMPPELHRADYIVSSNIVRTLEVCRQAVLDARRAVAWLAGQGYTSIGICGTSLGSCLAMLTAAHEPLVKAAALNHISPFFADVVWEGLSTRHVRESLMGQLDLDQLRRLWLPISPYPYLERVRDRRTLLVYARYDTTFPPRLSRLLVDEFRKRQIPHTLAVLPCGHYSTGVTPFKYLDGYWLTRFLARAL
jgi:dienelactone hydrolase